MGNDFLIRLIKKELRQLVDSIPKTVVGQDLVKLDMYVGESIIKLGSLGDTRVNKIAEKYFDVQKELNSKRDKLDLEYLDNIKDVLDALSKYD